MRVQLWRAGCTVFAGLVGQPVDVRVAGGVGRCERTGAAAHARTHVSKDDMDTYADLFDGDLDAVTVTLHIRYLLENAAKMRPRDGQSSVQQT
jgi:hypothetical protein